MHKTIIIDFLSNKNTWGFYKTYNESQWFTKEKMKKFQLNKLRKLLSHCYENVEFYRRVMVSSGINPQEISSLNILNKFPIINKEIIQENYDLFIPKNHQKIKGIKTSQTGGTTGNILLKRTDSNVRGSANATYLRFFDWMGVEKGDKTLRLMGGHIMRQGASRRLKTKINNCLTHTTSLNPYDKTDKNIERIIKELSSNKYKLLKGYSQNLFFLSNLLKEKGLRFNIPKVTTTAEPLMEEHRQAFKEVFNAESFDQYGCGEIGGIAYECNHHKGLHVAEERVILEINEANELIITDLDNFAMPYIRYWNADQAIVSKIPCSCGRESMLLEKIMGRTCDYISCIDGKQLHWAYFWHLLFDTKIAVNRNMKKFQILQRSLSEIDFRIVSDPLTDEDKETISQIMKNSLGNIQINFINESDIENSPSGKFRPVVNLTI